MQKITGRIERLEAAIKTDGGTLADITLPELIDHIETACELPPGSLPRTAEEAYASGYSCMAEAVSMALGMTIKEFRAWLTA